jgi:hypothetical protein
MPSTMVSDVEKGRVEVLSQSPLREGNNIEDFIARQFTGQFCKAKLVSYSLGWLCAMGFWVFLFSLTWHRKENVKTYLDFPCERYLQRECAVNRLQDCEGTTPSF